jgi:hypothetical protein
VLVAGLLVWLCWLPYHPTPWSTLVGADTGQATPDSELSPDDVACRTRREQILEMLGVRAWHEAGFRGQGLKVAILDTGFCGYRAHLGKALPERVVCRSFRLDDNLEARDSQHGILCAEVIHALAPEAELLLANWEPDRPDLFLDAVRWARQQGARVMSCSVIMPSWSDGEGHGSVHTALNRLLGSGTGAGDVLFFASAGNTAQRHWGGAFRDAGAGYHDWGQGQTENVIKPWGGEIVSVELCSPPGATYELCVEDLTTGSPTGLQSHLSNEVRGCTVVRFTPQAGHAYTLRVKRLREAPGTFHLVVLGGGLQFATKRGSIPFPADGPEVIAVGAVNQQGRRLGYSSCGPNSSEPKPDFVAPIPFPSSWRSRPFTGTSAAAPQAAALAALMLARHPDWNPQRVRELLKAAGAHAGHAKHDYETGFGQIRLPEGETR